MNWGTKTEALRCCYCGEVRVDKYTKQQPEGHGIYAPYEWVKTTPTPPKD